jgi:hypothetical protein
MRDVVLYNFRWKLTALLLALLVWFVIKFAIYRGMTGGRYQILRHQPVLVLKAPEDPSLFRVQPPEVDVVVQATKELRSEDLEVFVNVTSMPLDVESAFKQVTVRGADIVKVIRVDEKFVMVDRIAPVDASLTNSFKNP